MLVSVIERDAVIVKCPLEWRFTSQIRSSPIRWLCPQDVEWWTFRIVSRLANLPAPWIILLTFTITVKCVFATWTNLSIVPVNARFPWPRSCGIAHESDLVKSRSPTHRAVKNTRAKIFTVPHKCLLAYFIASALLQARNSIKLQQICAPTVPQCVIVR